MGRLAIYLGCGLLTFLVALLWQAPAALLPLLLPAAANAPLDDWRGSLWSGSARVQLAPALPARLQWDLTPGAGGLLGGDLTLTADGLHLDLQARLAGASLHLAQGRGELAALLANRLLNPYEIQVAGALELQDLSSELRDGWPVQLDGRLHWPGGPVAWRLADSTHSAVLPPLQGRLDLLDDQPRLQVEEAGRPGLLLELLLARDGWLTVRMTRRMAQLAGYAWQGEQPQDTVVLEVQQRLL